MKLSNIQKEVLHNLVDRHERRRDYDAAAKNRRRTLLKIDSKNNPDYFHVSSSSFRLMFNEEMAALQRLGFVTLEWLRFDAGHTLERVALVDEALPRIYQLLGRLPKKQIYAETAALLAGLKAEAPALLHAFYDHLLHRLAHYEPLPPPLRAEKSDELKDLLRGFNALCAGRTEEIVKRSLSTQLYGDSKRWQQLERGILQLLREFNLSFCGVNEAADEAAIVGAGNGSDAEADDPAALLAQYGIVDNPGHIHLSGSLVLAAPRGQIDLSLFAPDLGLPANMVKELTVVSCPAQAVVTVENLTAYYQYLQAGLPDQLVVYTGGFVRTACSVLLQKLHRFFGEAGRQVIFHHWGDLDLGGFKIWHNLKQKTGIPFQPLYMDEATYLKYLHLGQPITEQYAVRLQALLGDAAFAPFHGLINRMLEKKIRLEQEAVSPESGFRFPGSIY